MTKSQLIVRIARDQPHLVERDVTLAVNTMLEHMTAWLAGGGRIEIRGFGSFSLRYRRARMARDPRTGVPVSIGARYAPHFKPGVRLRARVDAGLKTSKPEAFATTDEQFGAPAPVAAAIDHARGETDEDLRRYETLLSGK